MTSAYGSKITGKDHSLVNRRDLLNYVPIRDSVLKDGTRVDVDFLSLKSDIDAARELLNIEIEQGQAWPFDTPLSEEEFMNYFVSHEAFVVLLSNTRNVIGTFYCKPNFPGRSSHFCNGGFVTRADFRGKGVGSLMGNTFLRVAKDLGYRAVLFNLVYSSNIPSIRLWQKLGFTRVGTLPAVGNLKDLGYIDADQYYKDLLAVPLASEKEMAIQDHSNATFRNLANVALHLSMFCLGVMFGRYAYRTWGKS